jgi:hypothetical protein
LFGKAGIGAGIMPVTTARRPDSYRRKTPKIRPPIQYRADDWPRQAKEARFAGSLMRMIVAACKKLDDAAA